MYFAAEDLTMGQMNALVKKIGGAHEARRMLRGELRVVDTEPPDFPIWRTVKVGQIKSVEEAHARLEEVGVKLNEHFGQGIFKPDSFDEIPQELELVRLTLRELGLSTEEQADDVIAKARFWGLELCPPEVGVLLCLQEHDTEELFWTHVGTQIGLMPATMHYEVSPVSRLLQVNPVARNQKEYDHTAWVFVRPKKDRE